MLYSAAALQVAIHDGLSVRSWLYVNNLFKYERFLRTSYNYDYIKAVACSIFPYILYFLSALASEQL